MRRRQFYLRAGRIGHAIVLHHEVDSHSIERCIASKVKAILQHLMIYLLQQYTISGHLDVDQLLGAGDIGHLGSMSLSKPSHLQKRQQTTTDSQRAPPTLNFAPATPLFTIKFGSWGRGRTRLITLAARVARETLVSIGIAYAWLTLGLLHVNETQEAGLETHSGRSTPSVTQAGVDAIRR